MSTHDYERVAAAIAYLTEHYRAQPSLDDVAAHVYLSPYHFARLFKRWAGVTPKQFADYLTLGHAKARLAASQSVLDAALDVGLSGGSRLHDLFVRVEAVTPGDYKRQGDGLDIAYGFHPTPFGEALVGLTPRGLCHLAFVAPGEAGRAAALDRLRAAWPGAALHPDADATAEAAARLSGPTPATEGRPLHLLLKGTNFQLQVWQALLRIPPGHVLTYGDVARLTGRPAAVRAVGQAVGSNPVGGLIPCHRVIRSTGALGGYLWGTPRKQALLGWEAAQHGIPHLEELAA